MNLDRMSENPSAVVGVIGLAYVGLPLMAAFHRAGFRVMGFDVDPAKIKSLREGKNYLKHLGPEMVSELMRAGRCDATSDFARLAEPDVVISCVLTPLVCH